MKRRSSAFVLSALLLLAVGCNETKTNTPEPSPGPSAAPAAVSYAGKLFGAAVSAEELADVLKATDAEYIVATLWAPWCGNCLGEAVELTNLKESWKKNGIAIIGLGAAEEKAQCDEFNEATDNIINYPLYCSQWVFDKYEITSTPTLFLYNATGDLLLRADHEEYEDLPAQMEKAIAKLRSQKKL